MDQLNNKPICRGTLSWDGSPVTGEAGTSESCTPCATAGEFVALALSVSIGRVFLRAPAHLERDEAETLADVCFHPGTPGR